MMSPRASRILQHAIGILFLAASLVAALLAGRETGHRIVRILVGE